MTVTTEDIDGLPIVRSGPYNGNGVAGTFDYDFPIQAADALEVVRQNADLSEAVLVLTTDYTVTGVGVAAGGQITLVDPATRLPTGAKLVIRYAGDFRQDTAYSNQGAIQLEQLEADFDKLTMHLRQTREVIQRAITVDSFGTTDVAALTTNISVLAAIEADVTAAAAVAADITTVAGVAADVATLADRLNVGTSPFSDEIIISGATPRVLLSETTGAPVGAEMVDLRVNDGVFHARARSAVDAAVETLLEIAYDNTGATEHRMRVGGTNRLRVTEDGATVAGRMAATSVRWDTPVAAISSTDPITDIGDIVHSGLYYAGDTALGKPPAVPASQAVYVMHMRQYSDTYCTQLAFTDAVNQSQLFLRNRQGGAFTPWRQFTGYEQSAAVSTASGTPIEFTDIPIGIPSFRLLFEGVGVNASGDLIDVQLRQSPGGVVTSGYVGSTSVTRDALATVGYGITSAIRIGCGASGVLRGGEIVFRRVGDGSVWMYSGTVAGSTNIRVNNIAGRLTGLTGAANGVRLTSVTGAFNAGGFRVEWGN